MGWQRGVAILLFTLGCACADGAEAERPAWFKGSFLDLRDDLAEASSAGKRLVFYFYQETCPYCAKLLQDNLGQRAIADKTRAYFDVVPIDIWGNREITDWRGKRISERRFAQQMRITLTPTLLFLDEKGKPFVRLDGYYPPQRFALALDYAAGHAGQGMHFNEYMLEVSPRPANGRLNVEPFFIAPPYHLDRSHTPGVRPLVVVFEQGNCSACDEFHRQVLSREATRKFFSSFQAVQLDLHAKTTVVTPGGEVTTARDWASQLKLQYTPALIFFDEAGREVFRTEAYLRAFHVQSALDYVASGAYRREPSFQRYVQTRANALRARGERVDLTE